MKLVEVVLGIFLILAFLEIVNKIKNSPCSVWSDRAYMCSSDNIGE